MVSRSTEICASSATRRVRPRPESSRQHSVTRTASIVAGSRVLAVHPEVVGSFSVPEERVIVVFDEYAQAQQISQALPAPTLPAATQATLQLFTQRFDRSASPRGPLLFHRPIMQVLAMRLKIVYFPFDQRLRRRAPMWGLFQ